MIKTVPPFFLSSISGMKVRSLVTAASLLAVCSANAFHGPTAGNKISVTSKARSAWHKSFVKRSGPAANDLEIAEVAPEYKTLSRLWTDQNPIKVTIKNNGTSDQANVVVDLNVVGANAEALSQIVPFIAAGSSETITFTGSIASTGTQVIEAKVPDDDDNTNNTKTASQNISCNRYGYTGSEPIYDGFGFGSGTGIVSARYQAPGIPVYIKGVTVHISNDPSNVGKSITGVLLDELGNIIADSEPYFATAGDLNTSVQIAFYSPVQFSGTEVFFAGIRQDEGGQAPVGVALPATTPANRYFTFAADGGAATHYTTLGSLKIGIMADVAADLTSSLTGQIMAGKPVTFTATSGFPDYTFKVNGVAVQSSFNNEYTYYPNNNDNVYVEISSNGCTSDPIGNFVVDVQGINPNGGVVYVNKNNPTPGDGSSWSNAVTELADVLRWAKAKEADWTGGSPLQVWVAGGTYKPLYSAADDNFGNEDGMNNSFLLVKNLKLYGGFAGTETDLSERDLSIASNKSILSGDFNGDDLVIGTAVDLVIENTIENANHVVISSGEVGEASLDGFTVSGGGGDMEALNDIQVNSNWLTRLGGGGVHNYLSAPSITNVVIRGNKSFFHGGGIYNDQSSPVLTNVLIVDNVSEFQGGGMVNANMSAPVLTNVTISNNNALVEGGGYINISSNPTIRNTIVSGNSSPVVDDNSTPTITYSLIEGVPEDVDNGNLNGSLDPTFNNPAAGNYTLKQGSPAINNGSYLYYMVGQMPDLSNIGKDLGGRPRISGSVPDLGAYESSSNDQIITAEDINRTYGDGDIELTAFASSGLPVSYALADNIVGDLYQDPLDNTKWKIKIKKAGVVVVTVSQGGDATYDPAQSVEVLLVVNRKELTVTADNKTIAYGENIPSLSISYDGFIGSETVAAITQPAISTTATKLSTPGEYPIILVGGEAVNYDLKLVHGTLTIEGAAINITKQPGSQSVCAGSVAIFDAKATTSISVAVLYQWQQSTDNKFWSNVAGATDTALKVTAADEMFYRCVLTAPGRVVRTDIVKLSVKPVEKPVINMPNIICLSEARYPLSASLPGGVFTGPGVSGSTWYIDSLKPGLQTVQYAYTNTNGCVAKVSKTASLSLCGDKSIVTVTKANPNPTTGYVIVKVLMTETLKQTVVVSNSYGQVVFSKEAQFRKGWNQMPIDLSKESAGIYFITVNGYGKSPSSVIRVMKE
ncbi:MBG domain-containing protein [Paraflavitalea sp. CAU 1676]|uniref:MBG domain-containing protein n=1 Tax=Paraflavitalea sp. CAU 1676 TaxID=3032598 RepID=UPI0023DC3CA4|nr:MBG domain-containing protein [Paraflavitalea sp. CAU 1676]MDF2190677.1 MBG domain-containing protein [Paraflavitalea sp. CAU 1676]